MVTEVSLGGYRGGAEARSTLNSFTQKQRTGTVKFEPKVHSAISASLRVLRASLAAAAARGGAPSILCGGGVTEEGHPQRHPKYQL